MAWNYVIIFCHADQIINRNILILRRQTSLHVKIAIIRYYTLFSSFMACYEVETYIGGTL